jgi:hypothetical protein
MGQSEVFELIANVAGRTGIKNPTKWLEANTIHSIPLKVQIGVRVTTPYKAGWIPVDKAKRPRRDGTLSTGFPPRESEG